MQIRFRGGRIYDPAQGLDGVIKDLFAQDERHDCRARGFGKIK